MKREGVGEVVVKNLTVAENKMDSGGIEYKPMCPEDIAKITNSKAALSRNFPVCDLVARHKKNLHIRGYVDYYGGYAEHTRNILFRLQDTGRYNIKLTPIKTPVDIDPIVWQKCNWFTHNAVDMEHSDFMAIAGPGWLQKKFLPSNGRKVFGWTMIESMNYSKECAEWLKNADWLICPTDTDVRRAEEAGIKNTVKVHLGYDDLLYHPDVEPIGITGLQKKFVFGVLGSWNVRKGVKDIIKAYCTAFGANDNTVLLLCCKYGNRKWGDHKDDADRWNIQFEFDQIMQEVYKFKEREKLPHIALMDIPVHETVLPHVMAKFDCLVGFSSGESTWLPGIQAMGMKIPVIQLVNDCCGYMEYLNNKNSYLCPTVKYETCNEEFWRTTSEYYEGQTFGFGEYGELAMMMNMVRKNIESREISHIKKVETAYAESALWTWDKSIGSLERFLESV